MCLLVEDIANSPKVGGNYTMFSLGGHMGPPLRRMGRIGGSYQSHFVILMLHNQGKYAPFTLTLQNLFIHCINISP